MKLRYTGRLVKYMKKSKKTRRGLDENRAAVNSLFNPPIATTAPLNDSRSKVGLAGCWANARTAAEDETVYQALVVKLVKFGQSAWARVWNKKKEELDERSNASLEKFQDAVEELPTSATGLDNQAEGSSRKRRVSLGSGFDELNKRLKTHHPRNVDLGCTSPYNARKRGRSDWFEDDSYNPPKRQCRRSTYETYPSVPMDKRSSKSYGKDTYHGAWESDGENGQWV